VWGKKVPNHLTTFTSSLDFIHNNILVMGSSILHLRDLMINNSSFDMYYPLIKKCIKLIAILHFKEEIGYISTTKDCYNYAVKHAVHIKNELALLFNFLEKDIASASGSDRDLVKQSIMKVTEVIFQEHEMLKARHNYQKDRGGWH